MRKKHKLSLLVVVLIIVFLLSEISVAKGQEITNNTWKEVAHYEYTDYINKTGAEHVYDIPIKIEPNYLITASLNGTAGSDFDLYLQLVYVVNISGELVYKEFNASVSASPSEKEFINYTVPERPPSQTNVTSWWDHAKFRVISKNGTGYYTLAVSVKVCYVSISATFFLSLTIVSVLAVTLTGLIPFFLKTVKSEGLSAIYFILIFAWGAIVFLLIANFFIGAIFLSIFSLLTSIIGIILIKRSVIELQRKQQQNALTLFYLILMFTFPLFLVALGGAAVKYQIITSSIDEIYTSTFNILIALLGLIITTNLTYKVTIKKNIFDSKIISITISILVGMIVGMGIYSSEIQYVKLYETVFYIFGIIPILVILGIIGIIIYEIINEFFKPNESKEKSNR